MPNDPDQFCKNVLRDALSLASNAETEVEVLASTQRIDVYSVPDPARADRRASMGLLGELSAVPAMFEPFHNTPSLRDVRSCLRKQLTWFHELERRARSAAGSRAPEEDPDASPAEEVPFPMLVVITTGRPEGVLKSFGFTSSRPGIHETVEGLATRVIVLSELPRTRETLLLRMLGKGAVLRGAIADLMTLPGRAWEKSVVVPFLVHFRLQDDGPATTEEDDVTSVEIRAWYEDQQQKVRADGMRSFFTELLRTRFGEVPASTVARIEAAKEGELARWGARLLSARALDEVFAEAS